VKTWGHIFSFCIWRSTSHRPAQCEARAMSLSLAEGSALGNYFGSTSILLPRGACTRTPSQYAK
jgi:hypothetical protein